MLPKEAYEKAHEEYPFAASYPNTPDNCNHNFSFIVYCDGGEMDIARCTRCGKEIETRCTFDDDYD